MLRPASAEFVALCRSQISLLTQTLGASLGAVYLTEELAESNRTELIPIVLYPEESDRGTSSTQLNLPAAKSLGPQLLVDSGLPPEQRTEQVQQVLAEVGRNAAPDSSMAMSLLWQQRLVLPLIHENLVLGFLVVAREDRPWQTQEQLQLEEIAHTLAIACVLDQRYQWLEHRTYHQQLHQEHRLALQAQQQDILANLLHQLRNPLTALRTLGKLLLKRLRPEDTHRQLVVSMIQQSDRLEQLLQQFDAAIDLGEATLDATPPQAPDRVSPPLLPGAGLTGGRLELQPCWLAEVLAPLLPSAAAIASERHLELQIDLPADLPPIRADVLALREVCSNLIDNALKYTPSGGTIRIQVSREPGTTHPGQDQELTISDTGPGIPRQDLERLFERYYRGVQAQGNLPGTGLGLAIARDLIHQMQGEIQVFSPAIGMDDVRQTPGAGPGTTLAVLLQELPSA